MRKTIKAAFRAYLEAAGRYPVAYPLAGALPPVFFSSHLAGGDPRHRPWDEQAAATPQERRHDEFDLAGWPELV